MRRRRFIKGVAVASAAVAGGSIVRPRTLRAQRGANTLPIPRVFDGTRLTAAPGSAQIFEGRATDIYGLNGTYLGPMIEIDRGEEFAVTMENGLPEQDLILHWHGLLVPSAMDGHPHQAVGPGATYDYRYSVDQRAGTYWYHPHTDLITGPQVYRGLAGLYIVHDEEERGLSLPSGPYDVPLILQDKQVSDQNQWVYSLSRQEIMRGVQGDTMLVNGTSDAELRVEKTRYRFRLLNAANARVFLLAFDDGRPFHLIASDGGLLSAPVEVEEFYLPPGGRAEILVDFSDDQTDARLKLVSREYAEEFFPGSRQGKPAELMSVVIGADGPVPSALPTTLASVEPLIEEDALRTRRFTLSHAGQSHTINDLVFEKSRIDFTVPINELEIWEFVNGTQNIHPMHLHGVQFQILDRNGSVNNLRPEDRGWKDMALLFPTSTVRLLVRFTAHTGTFMLHCHNLEHEDDGMMQNFMVDDTGSVATGDSPADIRMMPSVGDGIVTVQVNPGSRARDLSVTDMRGRTVYATTLAAGTSFEVIDLRDRASGGYLVRVGNEVGRFVIRR